MTSLAADAISDEPIVAWKGWDLELLVDGGVRLVSIWRSRPVGPPRPVPVREAQRAVCAAMGHSAPRLACTCGIYAAKQATPDHPSPQKVRSRGEISLGQYPVYGKLAIWGHLVEHTEGYRAEFAYPQRLRLLCRICPALRPYPRREQPTGYKFFCLPPTTVVPHQRAGLGPFIGLMPVCEQHVDVARKRLGRRIRGESLGARVVEALLLEAYAVDLLPELADD